MFSLNMFILHKDCFLFPNGATELCKSAIQMLGWNRPANMAVSYAWGQTLAEAVRVGELKYLKCPPFGNKIFQVVLLL